MSLNLQLAQKQQPAVGQATQIIASLSSVYPPCGYYFQYYFEIEYPSTPDMYRLLQNYSIDNVVEFTSMEQDTHRVRVTARLFSQFQQVPAAFMNQQFEGTLQVEFSDPSMLKPPACLPINHAISPLYHTPKLQTGYQVRLMILPYLPAKQPQFKPPITLPQPSELDFRRPKSVLGNMKPPIKLVYFTSWSETISAEMYLQTIGMVSGQIYAIKHQIKDGKKKMELKNKVSYQTEVNSVLEKFHVTPVFVSEYKDRAFYMVADNFPHGCCLSEKNCQIQQSHVDGVESSLLTAFGLTMANIYTKFEASNNYVQYVRSKLRIIESNGQYLFCTASGVNSQVFYGYNLHLNECSAYYMAKDLVQQMNQNCDTASTYLDQKAVVATAAGIPMRIIDIASINNSLYRIFVDQFEKWQADYKVVECLEQTEPKDEYQIAELRYKQGTKPQYRPLVRISFFQALENNSYLVAGQAEEVLKDNYFLYQTVSSIIYANKLKKLNADEMSVLSAVVLLIYPNGSVIHHVYISDLFPQNLNSFEFVKLQTPLSQQQYDIPGYYNQDAIVHSQISQFDATSVDCLIALPRQDAIIRLDFNDFKDNYRATYTGGDIILEGSQQDIHIYTKTKPICHLSAGFRVLLGQITPLSVARISNRMYVLCNSIFGVELMVLRIPRAMPNGARDMNDILLYESEALSSYTDSGNADEAYFESVKSQIISQTSDAPPAKAEEEEIGFEIKVLEKHLLESKVYATDGSVIGLLKGGCVVSWKIDDHYRVIEIKSGSCAFAAAVDGCNHLTLQRTF